MSGRSMCACNVSVSRCSCLTDDHQMMLTDMNDFESVQLNVGIMQVLDRPILICVHIYGSRTPNEMHAIYLRIEEAYVARIILSAVCSRNILSGRLLAPIIIYVNGKLYCGLYFGRTFYNISQNGVVVKCCIFTMPYIANAELGL